MRTKRWLALSLLAALALPVTPSVSAGEMAQAAPTSPEFEKLKALVGDWAFASGDGSVAVTYRLTAGGSVVQETLFPGSPHEMVTMYHLDGKNLMLTHYCGAGNQPRMKIKAAGDNKLVFTFDGGTNLDAKKDGHMHEGSMTFVDADTLKSEWVYYEGSKKGDSKTFDLKRKK